MKPLAWVHHVMQALATEETGPRRGNDREGNGQVYVEEDSIHGLSTEYKSATPPSWHSRLPPTIDLTNHSKSTPSDMWNASFEPESPPPLPTPGFDYSFTEDLINARTAFDIRPFPSSDNDSEEYPDSGYNSIDFSEAPEKMTDSITHVRGTSATIFQCSDKVPISIVVTTPTEEPSASPAEASILQRNSVNFPLETLKSDDVNRINPSFLMPPTDNKLDSRKSRKAQEFYAIQKWLITFLNSKGDQFPRKVRVRMMDLYCIRDVDLSPEIVAKFNAEEQDEGVVMGQQDVGDDLLGLSILGAVFRSQIEEVTPRKKKVVVPPPPPSWQRQRSPPKKLEVERSETPSATRTEAQKLRKDSLPGTSPKETLDMDLIPSWLGPLISTSTSSQDSLLANPKYLKRAYSTPNLKSTQPQHSTTDSSQSAPGLRPRGGTLAGDDAQRRHNAAKPSSFIFGAFGAMKDAMKRPSSKKLQKKRAQEY